MSEYEVGEIVWSIIDEDLRKITEIHEEPPSNSFPVGFEMIWVEGNSVGLDSRLIVKYDHIQGNTNG